MIPLTFENYFRRVCYLLPLLFFLTEPAISQSHPPASSTDHTDTAQHSGQASHHGSSGGHARHKNELGLFLGLTHSGRRDNDPAIGLEYGRKINQSFGIGALVEATTGDKDVWVAAIPFAYLHGNWTASLAPGIEGGHHGNHALLRLGGGYKFQLGKSWGIMPQINLDLVDSHTVWVFGAVFGFGF